MTVQWVLAKYVADLQRNEPQNIGVIVLNGDETLSRFIGEREDGQIDGRHAKYVRSAATYRAWVSHWRQLISEGAEQVLATADGLKRAENYFLEPGGQLLLTSGPAPSSEDLLDDLYTRLVDDTLDRGMETVGRLSDRVIQRVQARLGQGHEIFHESLVTVPHEEFVDELRFDYRYNNGKPHLMQKVGLTYTDSRSWDRVHSISWTFQQIQQASDPELRGADLIALVKPRTSDDTLERQLKQLELRANVVDVTDVEQAEEQLFELISD